MEIRTVRAKIEELETNFLNEYPIFGRRIGLEHFCRFFGITRQTLYLPDSPKNTKTKRIDRKSFTNEKFLKFLLSYK